MMAGVYTAYKVALPERGNDTLVSPPLLNRFQDLAFTPQKPGRQIEPVYLKTSMDECMNITLAAKP
jgi:hypothetical protein